MHLPKSWFFHIFVSQILLLKLFFHLRLSAPARRAVKARWQGGGVPEWSLGVCVQQWLGGWRRRRGLQTAWWRVRGRAHMRTLVLTCALFALLCLPALLTRAVKHRCKYADHLPHRFTNCSGSLRPDGVKGMSLKLTTLTNLKGTSLHSLLSLCTFLCDPYILLLFSPEVWQTFRSRYFTSSFSSYGSPLHTGSISGLRMSSYRLRSPEKFADRPYIYQCSE